MVRAELDLPDVDALDDLARLLEHGANRCQRRDPARADLWRRLAQAIDDGLDVLNQLYTHDPEG